MRIPLPLSPALAALILVAAVPAPVAANLLPTQEWIVAFNALPPGIAPGGAYNGGTVKSVNAPLTAIVVASSDPNFKTTTYVDTNVRYVEPNGAYHALFTPNDPRYADQYEQEQVRLPDAWDAALGSTSAKVCVIDTGARLTHEDLAGARYLGGTDLVNKDADPSDDHGHGTHVLGIAAATVNNAKGAAGAGNVGYHVVKAMDQNGRGDWATVADAITWCADNAGPNTVVSLSLSGGYSQLVHDAVKYAHNAKGMLVVAAAGNDGPCTGCVSHPAALPEVIAVTCTAEGETQCGFSSEGPHADLAAPGMAILNACRDSDTAYCARSGTSDSTPLVSGVAALYWSTNLTMTNVELRARLEATAQDLGLSERDDKFGHGEIDAKCLFENRNPCAAPPNDGMLKAEPIPALPFAKQQRTLLATAETGEPAPCAALGATVWYAWTAPGSGLVTVDTAGSTFDTVLAVYAGNPATTSLACNDDAPGGSPQALLQFNATAGATYAIQIGGKSGANGTASLSVTCQGCPENNAFANAFNATRIPYARSQTTVGATLEPGEPTPCSPVGATVWFKWLAPGSGTVTIDTLNSDFDTILAVYAGTALTSLTSVACNDQTAGTDQSSVTFAAIVGRMYQIQVGGYLGDAGNLQLSIQCEACTNVPLNDDFARPKVVVSSAHYEELGTISATSEPGEPQSCGPLGKTVWYEVTPHVSAMGLFKTEGSNFDTVLGVYTGNSLSSLTLVKCSDDAQGSYDRTSYVAVPMTAGVTYRVQIGGYDNATGALAFRFQCTTACFPGAGNDHRQDAIVVSTRPYSNVQSTVGFTMEPGELRPPYMGATAWYKYTAPAVGLPTIVTIDTYGSNFDTVLAVYLDGVYLPMGYNEDDFGSPTASRVRFTALPGMTYMLQAGGFTSGASSQTGVLQLNVS